MTTRGIDCYSSVAAVAAQLAADGVGFVGRYYSTDPRKNLTPAEAQALSAAGIRCVAIWETTGAYASFLGDGGRDGAYMLGLAGTVGQPTGSAIYAAVDFDAVASQMAAIERWFGAVRAGIAGQYRLGVYGSGFVCATLRDRGLADCLMLAQSRGWQGTEDFAGAHIIQGQTIDRYGLSIDEDSAEADDYGGFLVPVPAVAA